MLIPRPNYTRFNPTTNGDLHMGHLYMILVNEAEAHRVPGGKFVVRFDDDQEAYLNGISWTGARMTKAEIHDVINRMTSDISWMGIKVDSWQIQSDMQHQMLELLDHLTDVTHLPVPYQYASQINPELHWAGFETGYPYFPLLTAHKVLYDYLSGTNVLIRGEDLLDEFSLYRYYCDVWGMPQPRHVYLRRLQMKNGGEFIDISKTRGGGTIAEQRQAGFTPKQIISDLAKSCLIDPDGPWLLENVKAEPKW